MNLDLEALRQRLQNAQKAIEPQPRAARRARIMRRVTPAQRRRYLEAREQAKAAYREQIQETVHQELNP